MTIESHATTYPLIYPPRCRRPKKNLPKKKLATSGKSPAYVHHRKNSARAGKSVAGFLIRTAIRIHGRIHPAASALPPDAPPRVAVRTSYLAPAFARPCSHPAITTNHHEGASMTAYLISFSLAGLIAIAVWEALS
jgi:hypothetical protein